MAKKIFAETEKSERGRGPRTLLVDSELFDRREKFVIAFEGRWGEIGWELNKKCKSEADVIRALRPLDEIAFIREFASLFFEKEMGTVSAATVRRVRAELREVQARRPQAELDKERALQELKRADYVLDHARPKERRLIKRGRKKCRKEASTTFRDWRTLDNAQKELGDQLRRLGARFARQEIIDFCKSKRYSLTPLNLANAVSGLPHMGWRQSMRRSLRLKSTNANGIDYQVFKAICYLTGTLVEKAKRRSENTWIAEFREAILLLPSRHREAREILATQWFFLERAVRHAFRAKPRVKAFPFEITKLYFEQIRSRSQVEWFLAQQVELRLSKRAASMHNSLIK